MRVIPFLSYSVFHDIVTSIYISILKSQPFQFPSTDNVLCGFLLWKNVANIWFSVFSLFFFFVMKLSERAHTNKKVEVFNQLHRHTHTHLNTWKYKNVARLCVGILYYLNAGSTIFFSFFFKYNYERHASSIGKYKVFRFYLSLALVGFSLDVISHHRDLIRVLFTEKKWNSWVRTMGVPL